VSYVYGITDLAISTEDPTPQVDSYDWYADSNLIKGFTEVSICPETRNYKLGTYFIAVRGSIVSISVDVIDVSIEPFCYLFEGVADDSMYSIEVTTAPVTTERPTGVHR